MPLVPGARLGPYEILTLIGRGGMGEVYLARDPRLDRHVAVKVLPLTVSGDIQSVRRFEQEARAVAALQHPHICTVYDVGRQDDVSFFVMEYPAGRHAEGQPGAARDVFDSRPPGILAPDR